MRTIQQRVAERRAQGRLCAVPGCYRAAQKIGSLCEYHDKREERTGHPEGRSIRKAEIRAYQKAALEFIAKHRDHAGIRAALEWIGRLMAEARAPEYIHQRSLPRDRLARWLETLRQGGVEPEEVLATVAAMYLHRELTPANYRSDRHFWHQLATRVLRLAPARSQWRWALGKPKKVYDRVTVGTRELLARRLTQALGVLALRIARELLTSIPQAQPDADRIEGAGLPFTQH